MPSSVREDRQKEAPARREPKGVLNPSGRDRANRKAEKAAQSKEAVLTTESPDNFLIRASTFA
jgi:hypothetical protein